MTNSTPQDSVDPNAIDPPATTGSDDAGHESDSGEISESPVSPKHSRVRNTVFLSYSHADRDTEWYADVQEYLKQLSFGGDLKLWDDSA